MVVTAISQTKLGQPGIIKMSGSESLGQEEAACMRISGLCDHYSKLFTWMVGLNF